MNEPPPVRPPAPLDGYRILDFTERLQGPLATQTLGDLGADIVKVERLEVTTPEGNPTERYRRVEDGSGYDLDLYTAAFLSLNRNKRSIALDIKSEVGLAVARRLVGVCDVVYENFRPGVMERLGLGYDDCAAINPSIVYASASGYGPDGPYADRRGQDILAQAIGGLAMMNAPAGGRPLAIGVPIADVLGGMNGAMAVMAALLYCNRTGEGQHIFVNLLDSVLAAQSEEALLFLNTLAEEPQRRTQAQAHPYIPPPYGLYATRDGHIALPSGQQLSELSAILGIPDLRRDPRFATSQGRNQHREEFDRVVEDALATAHHGRVDGVDAGGGHLRCPGQHRRAGIRRPPGAAQWDGDRRRGTRRPAHHDRFPLAVLEDPASGEECPPNAGRTHRRSPRTRRIRKPTRSTGCWSPVRWLAFGPSLAQRQPDGV